MVRKAFLGSCNKLDLLAEELDEVGTATYSGSSFEMAVEQRRRTVTESSRRLTLPPVDISCVDIEVLLAEFHQLATEMGGERETSRYSETSK